MSKAVCMVSGGLDSAVAARVAQEFDKHEVYPIVFDYAQRHKKEIEYAMHVSNLILRREPLILNVSHPGGSSLTTTGIPGGEVPLDVESDGIPSTYVPGRNLIFSALAASYAEAIGAKFVYNGFNAIDYSGYPDCRPEFVEALNAVLAVGLKNPVVVKSPLITLTKGQIIQLGQNLEVPFEHTWSCYSGGATPCGKCDSCRIRAAGFKEALILDPALNLISMR